MLQRNTQKQTKLYKKIHSIPAATGDKPKAIEMPNIKQIVLLKWDEDWFRAYTQQLGIQMNLWQRSQHMQSLSLLLISCSHLLRASWKLLVHWTTPLLWGSLIMPQKVSNGKADVRSGARICCTKNSRAIVAGLQGLEIREMPKTTLKQKPLFAQCAREAVPASSRETHMKPTINLTRRNMEHHKAEEQAQSLLTYSARWSVEAELSWNFNSICNSPQIIITSFIKVKVFRISSTPSAGRIWMRVSY